jgi:hypothetical protein
MAVKHVKLILSGNCGISNATPQTVCSIKFESLVWLLIQKS